MDQTTETTQVTTEALAQPAETQATASADVPASDQPQFSPFERKMQAILDGDQPAAEADQATEPAAGGDDAPAGDGGEEAGPAGEADQQPAAQASDAVPVIRLPGRQETDPDFEVRVTPELRQALEAQGIDPQKFLERANQLRNEGMRRRQFEEAMMEIEADRQELAWLEQEIRERPAEFITERISPQLLPEVARAVLARLSDDQFQDILTTVVGWETDPAARRLVAAEARERSIARREQLQSESAIARQRQAYIRDIANQIMALVPDDMPDDQANGFFDFAVYKLDQWARSQPRGTRLDPAQVPELLEQLGALKPFGLSVNDQAARKPTRDTTSNARPVRPADDPELIARAKQTGEDLKRRMERKRLAVTTPAGAGAPAASLAPPKGQSFEERMNWLEKRLGLKR